MITRLAQFFGKSSSIQTGSVDEFRAQQAGRSDYVSLESCGVVFLCCRIIAESIAQLPLVTYQRDGQAKQRASDDPRYAMLHHKPNHRMSAFTLLETWMLHLLLRGNSYSQIVRGRAGTPIEIYPIHPDTVKPTLDKNQMAYKVAGIDKTLTQKDILHIVGPSLDGIVGVSPIAYAKTTVTRYASGERFGAEYYSGGGVPRVALKFPQFIDDKKKLESLQDGWTRQYGRDYTTPAILHGGMDVTKIGMSLSDANYVETQKLARSEIATLFRVPLYKIGEHEPTKANNEQQGMEFLTECLLPWMRRIEQAVNNALFDESNLYAEFLFESILRADVSTRYSTYDMALRNGLMTRNEVRARENMNPLPGGDEVVLPAYLYGDKPQAIAAGDGGEPGEIKRADHILATKDIQPERKSLRQKHTARMTNCMNRYHDSVIDHIKENLDAIKTESGRDALAGVFESLYLAHCRDQHMSQDREFAALALSSISAPKAIPDFDSFSKTFVAMEAFLVGTATADEIDRLFFLGLLSTGDDKALLEMRARWKNSVSTLSRDKVTKADGAVSKEIFRRVGVNELVWTGGTCPLCRQLNGKVVDIDEPFLARGESVSAEGHGTIWAGAAIAYPPLHGGCECSIVPR